MRANAEQNQHGKHISESIRILRVLRVRFHKKQVAWSVRSHVVLSLIFNDLEHVSPSIRSGQRSRNAAPQFESCCLTCVTAPILSGFVTWTSPAMPESLEKTGHVIKFWP